MTWFRRAQEHVAQPPGPDPEDTPEAMLKVLFERSGEINQSAGHLPVEAVVVARRVLDAVREVIDTNAERELDMRAIVSLRGILSDYLPTTVRAYLALDPASVDVPRASGRTPSQQVVEQLETLWESASDLLDAVRARDADALQSQGSFLSTKFSRSDLDL
jgi:hypothetical protein